MMTNTSRMMTGLLAVALLAGCDKAPEGQVVAVVNGEEVTMQELNAELGNAELPEGAAQDEMRNVALDNVINRRLLADLARESGIESSPEFVMRRRQLEEALLVQMLAQQTARDLKQPTAAKINEFVNSNPQMFADRTVYAVDQIRFATPPRNDYLEALRPVKSMDEAVAALNRLGIKFERGNVRIDSASLPVEMYRQVKAVGTSEPFVIPGNGGVTVSQILESRPTPVPQNQVTAVATNMIQQLEVAEQLDARIKAAKAEAGIDYQSGYSAPKTAVANNGAAKAAMQTPAKAAE